MGKAEIKIVFIAFIVWMSCVVGSVCPFLLGGALLYLEKDKWLKKQIISMLTLYTILCLVNVFVIGYFFEFIEKYVTDYSPFYIISRVYSFITCVVYVWLGIRALLHKPVLFAERFATDISGEQKASGQCPHCGKPVAFDAAFCTKCGRPLH